jgi:hypothetical protein
MRRMIESKTTRQAAIGLTAAGLLMAAGGLMHPQADSGAGYEEALAGMFDASAWTASHALVLLGYVVLAVSAALLARTADLPKAVRTAVWAVAAGATLGAIESVPHLLAASESTELVGGDATPLTDAHALLQVVTTPAVGLSIATLAVLSARGHVLGNGRIAAAVAVAGGTAVALSGPLLFVTEDPAFSPLFAGSAALAVWLVLAGARTARRLRDDAAGAAAGVEVIPAR